MNEGDLLRDLCEFDGMAPAGRSTRLIRIPLDTLYKHFEDTGNQAKFDEACLIPDVCKRPAGIWRGLKRKGQEEAFCYTGKELGEFAESRGKRINIPPGFVFVVFLTEELEVTKWCLVKECPDKSGFPTGYAERFGEQLWPSD